MGACGTSGFAGGHSVSSAQAAVSHTDNCMILCSETCKLSVVAAIDVGVFSRTSRSRGKGPDLVVYTCSAVGNGYRCLCGGRGWLQAYKQWQGPRSISEARANSGHINIYRVPGCLSCPCTTAEASQRYTHGSRVQ